MSEVKMPQPVAWVPLADEDRQRAFETLPDMLDGFLKKWGWLHFAKAIEEECRKKNADQLRAAVLQEREACAQIADAQQKRSEECMSKAKGVKAHDLYSAAAQTAHMVASAIRNQQDKEADRG